MRERVCPDRHVSSSLAYSPGFYPDPATAMVDVRVLLAETVTRWVPPTFDGNLHIGSHDVGEFRDAPVRVLLGIDVPPGLAEEARTCFAPDAFSRPLRDGTMSVYTPLRPEHAATVGRTAAAPIRTW